ncbi:replication-associated recombination protein A [Candidatus Saccharibacteria bacterium]|nr:replication-associated recombination protein A [Candidatus Saccharibacteria bacterium]
MLSQPLAEVLRPKKLADVVGQTEIIGENKLLSNIVKNKTPLNLIFWGPAGTGKTTLARIISRELEANMVELSAVIAKKEDITNIIGRAKVDWNLGIRTILFVDEIHRFSKAQQDTFLPFVESGLITLLGATTENPSFEIINPLLSRSRVVVLKALSDDELKIILKRGVKALKAKIEPKAVEFLAHVSGGDARSALKNLELAANLAAGAKITKEMAEQAAGKKVPVFDKKGEFHFNLISAFIKSMRAGDDTAALYYLARMVEAGEDPKFIARRMVVFASEDIGLAGNGALNMAVAAFEAIERIGMPEGGIVLSHVVTALARSKKSRETYDAWQRAKELAHKTSNLPPPLHLRNAVTGLMKDLGYGKNYKWEPGFKHELSNLPEDIDPKTNLF